MKKTYKATLVALWVFNGYNFEYFPPKILEKDLAETQLLPGSRD